MAAGTQMMAGCWSCRSSHSRHRRHSRPGIVGALLALGLVCGALAYVLYFRLIVDLGPTGALTVTYLIPLFGVLWGALFLHEPLTAPMVLGALVVVAGTALVLRG